MAEVLGIDIGGTRIKVGVVDLPTGVVRAMTTVPTPTASADALLRCLHDTAVALTGRCGLTVDRLAGVGVGIPGHVEENVISDVWDDLDFLDGPDFHHALQERFRAPAVLDNDARAIAAAEATFGDRPTPARLLSITLGTGLGVALALSGRPAPAVGHLAGHIPIRPAGRPCFCGLTDCLEALVSATGLHAALAAAGAPAALPPAELTRMFQAEPGQGGIADRYLDDLARGLVALIHVFAPDRVVLGGGLSHSLAPALGTLTRRVTGRLTRVAVPAIRVSTLMERASVLGGASLLLDAVVAARPGAGPGTPGLA